MKVRKGILLACCLMLLIPVYTQAQKRSERISWTSKPSSRTGLYTTKNYFVSNGVSIGVSALYYFGDVDNEGLAFNGGFNKENLSFGGLLTFSYSLPVSNHVNLKFNAMAGTLKGNNKAKIEALAEPRDDYRKFNSIFVQPSFGVQYYPFSQAGFYLYGGVAATVSFINYEFWYYLKHVRQPEPLKGNTYGILPMVQLGLGYSWQVAEGWILSAEVLVQEGLVDTQYMNLDAFPQDKTQNDAGVALGGSRPTWIDKDGNEHRHWNDGWFQVGLTVSYQWRVCERCRISGNYGNRIKPARQKR